MSLYTICSSDNQHCIIQHLKSSFHLCGKIHMPRSIQKHNFFFSQSKAGLLGKNGNSSGTLQLIIIQKCILVVHSSHPSDGSCMIKQIFRKGGFPCIYMGQKTNADMLCFFLFRRIFHENTPFYEFIIQGLSYHRKRHKSIIDMLLNRATA